MKAAYLAGEGRVEVRQVARPEPGPGEVLVRVRACGLCGSDLYGYHGRQAPWNPEGKVDPRRSKVVGHEIVGEVAAVNGPMEVGVGERIAVRIFSGCGRCFYCVSGVPQQCNESLVHLGGHAEYLVLPTDCCGPLPDEASWEEGVLLAGDNIGAPYSAVKKLAINSADTAAIFGCGPMGLGAVVVLQFFGARIFAIEPIEYRRALACRLGAEAAIDPAAEDPVARIRELTDGRGVDVALDCSGAPVTLGMALESAARQGRVALIGEKLEATIRPSLQIIHKELTVLGCLYYARDGYFQVLDLHRRGLNVSGMITHRFPLADVDQAYATFASGQTGKVLTVQSEG